MITFVRTVSIMPGKTAEILGFAHQVKTYVKQKYDLDMVLSMPIGGNPNRIAFVATTPSLSDFETLTGKLATDAEYQQIIATSAANIIPGSVHDELWRALDDAAKPASSSAQ